MVDNQCSSRHPVHGDQCQKDAYCKHNEHVNVSTGRRWENRPLQATNPKDEFGRSKPDLSLVPPSSTIHEATAFMDGAKKYGAYNWRENKVSVMTYLSAGNRHVSQYLDGEDYDPVSKVHHLAHAKACYGIVLDAVELGNLTDDRPPKGPASDLMKRIAEINCSRVETKGAASGCICHPNVSHHSHSCPLYANGP